MTNREKEHVRDLFRDIAIIAKDMQTISEAAVLDMDGNYCEAAAKSGADKILKAALRIEDHAYNLTDAVENSTRTEN